MGVADLRKPFCRYIERFYGEKTVLQEPYWWYILFVHSGSESHVISDMKTAFGRKAPDAAFDVFYPEAEQYYRSKKLQIPGHRYRRRPLFPGYVFIETDMPEDRFLYEFSDFIYHSEEIIRILKNGAGGIALPDGERRRFEYLLKGKRCLEHSVGYIIGDKIVVEAGPLVGREGIIQKINRHNRDAIIEAELFGEKITMKIALEIIAKKQEEQS